MRVRIADRESLLAKAKSRRTVRQLLHTSSEHVEIFWHRARDCVRRRSIASESERGRHETTKKRRSETERTRAVGTRQSRRRDVYVYAKLRHFAEHGIGVNYGAEERRDRICRGSIRGGRANSAFGEAIEGKWWSGCGVYGRFRFDRIRVRESLFQVG